MTLIINDTRYRVDFTFALTVTLMLIFCQEDTVIICLLSSLFHEAGHLILMCLFRQKITDVTFGAFGIRINRLSTCNLSYKKEAIIASGGICINFLIALVSVICYSLYGNDFSLRLSAVNIFIALFNMIPIDTLDIGRVLRYTLLCRYDENKSDRILYIISAVSVNLLAVGCIVYTVAFAVNPSLIAVTIYLYVITLFKKWS